MVALRALIRLLVGIAVLVCAAVPFEGSAQTVDRILIGSSTDDTIRPVLYAIEAGLFQKAGLDVEVVKLANGAAVAAAVVGGSVQLGKGSGLTPVQAYVKGIPFIVTASLSAYTADHPATAMLVLNSSPMHAAKDLDGARIGVVALNDTSVLGIYSWLEKSGLELGTMKFLELGNSAGAAALQAGRVDAMMFVEPALSAALATGSFRILSYPLSALGQRFSVATMFGLTSWVNAHSAEVLRFNRVLSTAEAYIAAHEDETKPLAAKFADLDPSQLDTLKPTQIRTTGISARDLQIVIDAAAKYKLIPKGFSADDLICSCAVRQR